MPIKQLVDYGFGAGVAMALLQLAALLLPEGEGRDWLFYILPALWAALWVGAMLWQRIDKRKDSHCCPRIQTAAALYAVAAVSYYTLPPLCSRLFLWLWPLAALVAWEWQRRMAVDVRTRIVCAVGMMWCVLVAFSLSGSLLTRAGWFGLISGGSLVTYALPYVLSLALILPWAYHALRDVPVAKPAPRLPHGLVVALHVLAAYLLAVPLFRTDGLAYAVSTHHWKAFLEPAASVRAGGWLLWDVPAQYGFLPTLLVAFLPSANVWQSFYLLNGALLSLTGLMLFTMLFTTRRTVAGCVLSFIIALSCTAQLLPFIDPRMMPSTGSLRFLFVYVMAGYVFCLSRRFDRDGALPARAFSFGNALWLAAVWWSFESAVFVSIIWLPSLAMVAVAEIMVLRPLPVLARHVARRLLAPLVWLLLSVLLLCAVYGAAIGHLPDFSLYTAYATSYTGGFNNYPILRMGIVACWLLVFVLMLGVLQSHVARAGFMAGNLLRLAVLYAALSGLWAVVSAFIPISDDVHLVGTLPVLVYLAAMVLCVLPQLATAAWMKHAYRMGFTCLQCVIVLGTINCFKPGIYSWDAIRAPITGDITTVLPTPPQFMQDMLRKENVAKDAALLVLASPFSLEEGAYFHDMQLKPWMLPNTMVAYDKPLSPELMQRLAARRLARMDAKEAWIIERKDNPLSRYPWVAGAAERLYRETRVSDYFGEYTIRHFERIR